MMPPLCDPFPPSRCIYSSSSPERSLSSLSFDYRPVPSSHRATGDLFLVRFPFTTHPSHFYTPLGLFIDTYRYIETLLASLPIRSRVVYHSPSSMSLSSSYFLISGIMFLSFTPMRCVSRARCIRAEVGPEGYNHGRFARLGPP